MRPPALMRHYGRLFSRPPLIDQSSSTDTYIPSIIPTRSSQYRIPSRYLSTASSENSRNWCSPSSALEKSTVSLNFPHIKRKQRKIEDVLRTIFNSKKSSEGIPGKPTCPECPICLSTCKSVVIIKACLHVFCRMCLVRWRSLSRKTTCPLCLQSWDLVVTDIYSMTEWRVIPFFKLREEYAPSSLNRGHLKNRASIYTLDGPPRTAIPSNALLREPAWFVTNEIAVKRWLRREILAITDLDTLNAEPLVWKVLRLLQKIPLKISRAKSEAPSCSEWQSFRPDLWPKLWSPQQLEGKLPLKFNAADKSRRDSWNPKLTAKIWDILFHSTEIFLHELYVFTNVSPLSLAEFDSWVAKSRTIDLTQSNAAWSSIYIIDSDVDQRLQSDGIDLTLSSDGEIDLTLPSEVEDDSDRNDISAVVIDLT